LVLSYFIFVGSEKEFVNRWSSDTFRVSHAWLLGYHYFFAVWSFAFFIDDGAGSTPILENRRGVDVFV